MSRRFTIPLRMVCQFPNRITGQMEILIAMIPPWPGPEDAEASEGLLPVAGGRLGVLGVRHDAQRRNSDQGRR